MLKVLIADDEPNIREGLIQLIDWNYYGFSIAGTVSNGIEALDFIKQESPDLLITDIRMPDMDGLKLIENVRTFNDNMRIIVLSGYDTFSYAQKAMQYNAERYLLKPIEEDDLIECLNKIRQEYEASDAANKEYAPALLRTFLSGQPMYSSKAEKIFPRGKYYYILIEPYVGDSALFTAHKEDYILQLKSAVNAIFSNKQDVFVLPELGGTGIVVNSCVLKLWNGEISEFARELNNQLESNGLLADILVGCCVENISELYKSGNSIKICREKKFYSGANERVIICNGDKEFSLGLSEINLPDKLVKATVQGGYDDIKNTAAALCETFQKERVSPTTVMLHVDNILVELFKEVESMGGDRARLLVKRTMFGKAINVTINTVRIFLEDLCRETAGIIMNLRRETFSKSVSDIVMYVRENYMSDIDLNFLSEKFFKTPSHLGRMFKKSVGMSFNTFLNKIRVDEAKKLLRRSDCKVYEIAYQVGFKDPNYFSVKFEELEGMTPTQYRDSNLNHFSQK